jgi:rod shape determining protein RodA
MFTSTPTKIQSSSRRPPFFKKFLLPYGKADWSILLIAIGLTAFGGVMIRSTELNKPVTDWWQHWLLGGFGVIIALILTRVNYQNFLRWHWAIYGANIAMLIAVMLKGASAKGAQRWIYIGPFNFQPSEFAKLALIITLAAVLHRSQARQLPEFLKAFAITLPPWLLVFIQPDLGSSLVFGVITMGMLYWAGANPGWIVLLASPLLSAVAFGLGMPFWIAWSIAMGILAWFILPWRNWSGMAALAINVGSGFLGQVFWNILKDYQKERLTTFLNPEKDALGGGYHLIQSRIAIGAGGFWGQGITQGTQTQLNFIPEQHTDFIFSAIGEECGFVGCILLLGTFWYLCWRIINVALTAKDNFGSLLVIGIVSMLAFQVVLNIGMNTGIAPVTGIPLPWISYGRTALLKNFISIGLIESVAAARRSTRV